MESPDRQTLENPARHDWGRSLGPIPGADPVSIRGIARRVGRDIKTVHSDVQALPKAGVVDRAEGGRVVLPYDAVHVDFVLNPA